MVPVFCVHIHLYCTRLLLATYVAKNGNNGMVCFQEGFITPLAGCCVSRLLLFGLCAFVLMLLHE